MKPTPLARAMNPWPYFGQGWNEQAAQYAAPFFGGCGAAADKGMRGILE